jgi:hypothetical protein
VYTCTPDESLKLKLHENRWYVPGSGPCVQLGVLYMLDVGGVKSKKRNTMKTKNKKACFTG